MANLDFYKSALKVDTVRQLEQLFCDTLVETNCTYSFFVDWKKVNRNRDCFRHELALFSSLRGAANPKRRMRELISQYPEVVRALPLLIGERLTALKVLAALAPTPKYVVYNFHQASYSDVEIRNLVEFCEKTGLLRVLTSLQSPLDYSTGVEVGLDTNARKNRSGNFMENAVGEVLSHIVRGSPSIVRISQKQFKTLKAQYAISVPQGLEDRKFDEAIISAGGGTNIEINFYGGSGSKPSEIVDSYIQRKNELESIGWRFIWVTDGGGWIQMRNQLRKGLENLDYVLNLHMLAAGMLERILLHG
ncbi:MAG: type II restriction endonuclease [Chloroflexi bacterium]|nr:type II restriction endonuclease [Chloroflexota bacterium]